MKNLNIEPTENSLGVDFNAEKGNLGIEGASYPEDAPEFFRPLEIWLKDYIAEIGGSVTLNLKIGYLNSSSIKCLLDFIQKLEEYHADGGEVKIFWYYEEDDEDIQEMGEELAEDMNLPVELIIY